MKQHLTPREIDVLSLVARGLRNSEVGERLGTSPCTVRNQLRGILSKLVLRNRTELARYAIAEGIVPPPEVRPW